MLSGARAARGVEVWLARHGETTWNVAGRYQGRLESTLSELGKRQAAALAEYFSERVGARDEAPRRVVSSPMVRCVETARPCAEVLRVPVKTDERLIEIAHGTWEGRYRDELATNDPERYRAWREDPAHVGFEGGEALTDVLERWRAFAASLARDARPALVVTHDAVIRCALVDLEGRPLDDFWKVKVGNAAFARLRSDGKRLNVLASYCADHLGALEADTARQAL